MGGVEAMIGIGEDLKDTGIRIAYTVIEDFHVHESSTRLLEAINDIVSKFRASFKNVEGLAENNNIRSYRRFFWRMKLDPTKWRPSPEALARRVLRGSSLPSINNIVDAANASSLWNLVSIGLYDLDKVEEPLYLDRAKPGDSFEPIGRGRVLVPPGVLVLRDSRGVILHVYAHRDSRISMVTGETRRILAIAYGVPGLRGLEESLVYMINILGDAGETVNASIRDIMVEGV
ncbi:MAG: hypothetical protein GSR86_03295 [Desulfurococcales archaeon]|nr:hypothetical protein [Desulfurococcales archaeon]